MASNRPFKKAGLHSVPEIIISNMRKSVIILIILSIAVPGLILAEPVTGIEKVQLSNPQPAVINPWLRGEPRINLNLSVPVEYTSGIDLGAFYDLRTDLYLNRYLNFFLNFRLGPNIPTLDAFSAGWDMAPLSFFRMGIHYQLEYFPQYRILEQNAALITALMTKNASKPHFFDFEFLFGANFRFITLDLKSSSSVYRRDWLFEWFFLYRFDFLFHPFSWFSTGFSFGNYNETVTFSSNYFQVEFRMIFKLPARVSIQLKGGFAFCGFLMNPGYINKGWGELGVSYEIPFK
jgi:hypothetical protein